MKLLNRESLLKKDVLKIEKVQLSEDEYVYVRQMTGRERDSFEKLLLRETKVNGKLDFEKNLDDFRAKLAVTTLCDEEGNILLTPGDYSLLSQNMAASKLEKIVTMASKMNAISEEDKEALVKNSTASLSDGSTLDSV